MAHICQELAFGTVGLFGEAPSNKFLKKNADLVNEINMNPMGLKIKTQDALDWPHAHFVLSATYARAVLSDRAFIPVAESRQVL